jgi:hypothetical protein
LSFRRTARRFANVNIPDITSHVQQTMTALRDGGVPESLWPTAFPLVFEVVLNGAPAASHTQSDSHLSLAAKKDPPDDAPASKKAVKSKTKRIGAVRQAPARSGAEPGVLSSLPDQETLFASIERETTVPVEDLRDVFHVENGQLEIKVPSRDLGPNSKVIHETMTSLLAGVVFAGTTHKLPTAEITQMCDRKRVADKNGNAARFIKGTTGVAAVGTGRAQSLTPVRGWQDEFKKAVDRVLKRGEQAA